MASDLEKMSDDGLGEISGERFAERAIVCARELAEAEPKLERWIRPLVRAIKRRRLRLPSLSPTVNRVLRIIESPEVDLDELAEAVGGDPVLATRIMGVANSSFFRGATEVPNVREALMRMGVREARTIVIVVALRGTVLRSPGLGNEAGRLWRHSLLTATATQEIAAELPPWETAGFLAGLVHDLGQLAILAFASELPAWQDDGAEPTAEEIRKLCDAVHAPLGAMVLASWGFLEVFCDAVLGHHDPESIEGEAGSLAQAVSLGHRVARQIDEGWPDDVEELDASIAAAGEGLGLDFDRLADIAEQAEANFQALNKLS